MKESTRLETIHDISITIRTCRFVLPKGHREMFEKIFVPELEKYAKLMIPLAYHEAKEIIDGTNIQQAQNL